MLAGPCLDRGDDRQLSVLPDQAGSGGSQESDPAERASCARNEHGGRVGGSRDSRLKQRDRLRKHRMGSSRSSAGRESKISREGR